VSVPPNLVPERHNNCLIFNLYKCKKYTNRSKLIFQIYIKNHFRKYYNSTLVMSLAVPAVTLLYFCTTGLRSDFPPECTPSLFISCQFLSHSNAAVALGWGIETQPCIIVLVVTLLVSEMLTSALLQFCSTAPLH